MLNIIRHELIHSIYCWVIILKYSLTGMPDEKTCWPTYRFSWLFTFIEILRHDKVSVIAISKYHSKTRNNCIFLFQTQRTFFNKNFDRAVDEVTPDLTKYGWLVMLPNEYVNKTAEIPLDIFKDIKVGIFSNYL